MAIDEPLANSRNARIKLVFQLAVHVPFWALILIASVTLGRMDEAQGGASESLAVLVGLAVISFGLVAAGFGACAGFLEDSEEADDLRRESRALLLGAGALVSSGSSLILLTLAGPDRLVPSVLGLSGAIFLNAIAMAFVAMRWRRLDELNRGVAREANHFAFTWFSLLGGTWATLAHLGFADAPTPLDWLTMFNGFSFVAGLFAAGRRGAFADPTRSASAID